MSAHTPTKRTTITDIAARKGADPVVVLTCYSAPMAQILDPHVDVLLVGDSLGNVVYGLETTLAVTLDMMINHGAATVRGSKKACVIVDLPFGAYQESKEQAFRSAARLMAETGCSGVKLEGGAEMAETVEFLTRRGVPVMGHVGLMPQSVHTAGGFRAHGREEAEAARIIADAKAIAEAGAFSIVLEGTVEPVSRRIAEEVPAVIIGIGASPACDGQVLVTDDVLGLFTTFKPKFVKRYANLAEQVSEAARAYAEEVRARQFPAPEHCFGVKKP
ncbi:3-methyl-2-oxobutanoate hydroxymethyltransferase [Novispirillum sp. DQ9]|uniref:3-methyl-2-oxobutanoate hydroxymethyltransferase n=1 Tax=Novispirillum sp. DQ9 TaxID=3398612 RepID=UPI003C7E12A2